MGALQLAAAGAALILLSTASAAANNFEWSSDDASALAASIDAGEYGRVTSLWIEQNGELVYERYFNGASADTRHNMRSVGKTVTGMLVGAAIDDGLIDDVDVKASRFFRKLKPFDHPDPRKNAITIEDLLTMSGPLECNDWNSFSRGNEERMYLVEDWSAFFWNLPIKNRPSWEIPDDDGGFGRSFSYCTAGAQLLGEIVERATSETAPDYAARRLFEPIGITDPKWNFAQTGKAHLGGGLELTTSDWAKVGRLAVNRGKANGEEVLSQAWMDASLADHVQTEPGVGYGYFWWRPRYKVGDAAYSANMMSGSGANRVYALPEFGVVVVITKSDFRDREAHAKIDAFFEKEIVGRLRLD